MTELIGDKKVYALSEVALSIQRTIAQRYTSSFWVKAEMNKLNHYAYSGHCYPELLEKVNGKVVAQMKATLWKNEYLTANARFLKVLKEPLKDGIKILFLATVNFDPVHGFSLRMVEIDPVFSLGELEREKQETIERLQKEEIFDRNRQHKLALLPQRIAVVSVETSKGYADFISILDNNPWGYRFTTHLFPSLLQGDQSIVSIIQQLNAIRKVADHFDAVAIIRGGGGDVGLSSFNNYTLAREVALFPLPVVTGIGHSTNVTVTEMVSFMNAITPTELADFFIQKFHDFAEPVHRAEDLILKWSKNIIKEQRGQFTNVLTNLKAAVGRRLMIGTHLLDQQFAALSRSARHHLAMNRESLNNIEKSVNFLDPVNVLRRGYTITLHEGKALKDITRLQRGDEIITMASNGSISSTIDTISS